MAMGPPAVPEGYLPVVVQTDNGPHEIEILYPADPGSIYHMTKTQDALFFHYTPTHWEGEKLLPSGLSWIRLRG